jgi:hypothetical protein
MVDKIIKRLGENKEFFVNNTTQFNIEEFWLCKLNRTTRNLLYILQEQLKVEEIRDKHWTKL